MKFRKKPIVVDAIQFDGKNHKEIYAWVDSFEGESEILMFDDYYEKITIDTLEGSMETHPGDWIIRGVAGEYYPCKPEIFEATYERVQS